ncbi:MAG: hypothetical protein ABJF10_02665 [Chthoniobacter sp.]|uniref:hypothetical protein n=1 Tax=Chthoniobacter sp. TaxID=2510640 RepID=UPI0032AA0271
MNLRPILASLLLVAGLSGCATFTDAELGQIRQRGVSSAVVGKLQNGRVLSPGDVIELTRRGVSDTFILRQIDDAGVDYVLNRDDVKKLKAAHVSRPVMDALYAASDDFADRYSGASRVRAYGTFTAYPYNDYYYGGYPYAYPYPYGYPYGGVSVEIGGGRYYGGGHRHWR